MFDFVLKHKKNFKEKKNQSGFLVIELIIAIFIFGIVMTISIGSLVTALDSNRKSQALKSVLNNLEIAMDTLTKTISAGRYYQCAENVESGFVFTNLDQPDWCDTADQDGHTAISFVSNENLDNDPSTRDALVYRLNHSADDSANGFIERKRFKSTNNGVSWSENDDEWVRMTAPEVDVTDFKLYMTGTAPIEDSDFNQPKVTIYLAGEVRSAERTGTTRFAVQTVVTQLIPDF